MSDFAKWLRRFENERSVYGFSADLADLAAQQHEALLMHACIPQPDRADCRRAADVALKAAEEFQEKYE